MPGVVAGVAGFAAFAFAGFVSAAVRPVMRVFFRTLPFGFKEVKGVTPPLFPKPRGLRARRLPAYGSPEVELKQFSL